MAGKGLWTGLTWLGSQLLSSDKADQS